MFSPPSAPNTFWTNLALTFILLLLILWAVLSLWPDPKTARKIKNKMTWHLVTTIEKENIDKETRLLEPLHQKRNHHRGPDLRRRSPSPPTHQVQDQKPGSKVGRRAHIRFLLSGRRHLVNG